jgi:drug/metabolite transporter (DMT)-like permease
MTRATATLIGFSAILSWAFLALLSTAAGPIPPFQLAAMSFTIGGLAGAVSWPFRPGAAASLKQNGRVWLNGFFGLCLYHCVYFYAIQSAPPVEASLIAYLWPLFIVVMASFLPGERLRLHHVAGVVLGLLGTVLIISKGGAVGLGDGLKPGHVAAFACALIWSSYSVMSRRLGHVPTDVVVGYCLLAAVVTAILHLIFEPTVVPATATAWGAIVLLGLFPLGLAFYTWDFGVKRGDIMVLGAASYASPLLSTLVLLLTGYASGHWSVIAACVLITLGAVTAAKDMILRPRRSHDAAPPHA